MCNQIYLNIKSQGGIFDLQRQISRLKRYVEDYDNITLCADYDYLFNSCLIHLDKSDDTKRKEFKEVFYEYIGDVITSSVVDINNIDSEFIDCSIDDPCLTHNSIMKASNSVYMTIKNGQSIRHYPNILIEINRPHIDSLKVDVKPDLDVDYIKNVEDYTNYKVLCVHMRLGDTGLWSDSNDDIYKQRKIFYPKFSNNKTTYDSFFDVLESKVDFNKIDKLNIISDFTQCARNSNKLIREDSNFHNRHLEAFMERFNSLPIKNKKLSLGTSFDETISALELLKESDLVIVNRASSGLPAMNFHKYKTPNIFVWDL